CTSPAGDCASPGNDTQTLPTPRVDDASHTDLNVVVDGNQREVSSAEYTSVSASDDKTPDRTGSEGNYVVLYGDSSGGATSAETYSGAGDWDMTTTNAETPSDTTGKNNEITLTSSTGQAIDNG